MIKMDKIIQFYPAKNFQEICRNEMKMNEIVKRKRVQKNSVSFSLLLSFIEFLDFIFYQRATILKNSFAKIFSDLFAYEYECRMLTRLMLAYLLRFSIRG